MGRTEPRRRRWARGRTEALAKGAHLLAKRRQVWENSEWSETAVEKMKIIMAAVVSTNGKLTHGSDSDIYKWTSPEDQRFFFDLIAKNKVIVMGSGTYEAIQKRIKLDEKRLRIVLTRKPDKYKKEAVPGQLEFSSETPRQLINRLINYREILLVGGSQVYASFLKEGLVDEIYLTIEPVLFGKGKNLFAEGKFNSNLKLERLERLNKKGTLLLKYRACLPAGR